MSGSGRSFLLGFMIVAATVCLVLGLTLPIMRLTRFYIWTDVHSLVSVVRELYYSGEVILAAIIAVFSIFFPFLKLLYLLALYSARQVHPGRPARWLRRMSWVGKWSMLDVLILALVIFYAKATNLADATSMPGIYLFAASVILTMIATAILEHDLIEPADYKREEDRKADKVAAERRIEVADHQMPAVLNGPLPKR
jgi:paraquat-inducible protein A